MCGIVGEVSYRINQLGQNWVANACAQMSYRGPDGTGIFHNDYVIFGHRRLSIIDLSTGDQPMTYQSRYTITYNGEIYNYQEIKQELVQHGMQFRTQSDTEVIVAAYAFWGVDCLKRFNGIFSFAIWDSEEHKLLIARDHFGVKPLLYHYDDDGIRFASELKALMSHSAVKRTINTDALEDYLMMGYVLSPKTMIQDVYKLPPGSYLIACKGDIQTGKYWDLASHAQMPAWEEDDETLIAQFKQLLQDKVKQQMVSDVPVGAFLSGGIDSSTISLFASQATPHPIQTFSAGFQEASYSELDYATLVANHVGTNHFERVITPPSLEMLRELVWKYDEPLGDTSLIATYFVADLAREHVKVVLSGDGGDELLAGYDTYIADKYQSIYRRIPSFVHNRMIMPAVNQISSSYKKVSWDFKVKQFVSQAYNTPSRAHFGWRQMFDEQAVKGFIGSTNSYHPFDGYSQHYHDTPSASPLTQSLYVDINTWLVDDILTKVDRATMACSLEARVPFLAWDLVQFSFRLPDHLKLHGMERKYVLKRAMQTELPTEVINRKKRGFNSPIGIWLKDNLKAEVNDIFSNHTSQIVDVSNPQIQTMWKEHADGHVDHTFKLWTLLSLLLWEQSVYQA